MRITNEWWNLEWQLSHWYKFSDMAWLRTNDRTLTDWLTDLIDRLSDMAQVVWEDCERMTEAWMTTSLIQIVRHGTCSQQYVERKQSMWRSLDLVGNALLQWLEKARQSKMSSFVNKLKAYHSVFSFKILYTDCYHLHLYNDLKLSKKKNVIA